VKVLADEEDETSKVILIGINQAGQTLVEYAPDVLHRLEVVSVGRTNEERILEMIQLGEQALNCRLTIGDEISREAQGSFAMAQVLCHEACIQGRLLEFHTGTVPKDISVSLPGIREAVLAELGARFHRVAREFSTGKKVRSEGRAPYLNLLRWTSLTPSGALDIRDAMAANPNLRASVSQVIEKGHLITLIAGSTELTDLIHFEPKTSLLTIEDPKFLYFIRHIIWSTFAKQIGYFSIDFKSKFDFALSFAGEDRNIAETLFNALNSREISVFYDKNEQHRILANDVEEYLAPIYRSESRFVVPLLSGNYPKKMWTKFESENFKQRFGADSVIPIWFSDAPTGIFDETRKYGGLSFDISKSVDAQIQSFVEIFARKLEDERQKEAHAADSKLTLNRIR
jgi:hypothetical protein